MATGGLDENILSTHDEPMAEPVQNPALAMLTPEEKRHVALDVLLNVTENDLVKVTDDLLEIANDTSVLPDLTSEPMDTAEPDIAEHAEVVDGKPPVKFTDTLIQQAMDTTFADVTTKKLDKQMTKARKQMDAIAKSYLDLSEELDRQRGIYIAFAKRFRYMNQERNIRETLDVEGKLPRPLSDEQLDSLRGMKLKVLRTRKVKVQAPVATPDLTAAEKEQQEFIESSFNLLKQTQYEARNKLNSSKYEIAVYHSKRLRCELCSRPYKTKEGLKSHMRSHAGEFFQCQWCPSKRYTSEKSYKVHLRYHVNGDQRLTCDQCPKTFENCTQLDAHLRCHAEPTLKCRIHRGCGHMFRHNKERIRHETATEISPYLCSKCCKGYKKKTGLDRHMLSHGRGMPGSVQDVSSDSDE